jgi:hypothetical protein
VRNVSVPALEPVPASFRTMLMRALTFFDVFVRWALYVNVRSKVTPRYLGCVPHVESLCRKISRPTVCLLRVCLGEKRRIRSYLDSVVISIFEKTHRAYRDRLSGLVHTQQTNWLEKSMRCRQVWC